jgi:hypothetical protein
MEPARLFLIVCATIFIGIGIPAGLYFMLRQENRSGFLQIMQKTASEVRQPFKKDQEQMDELARRVADLKNKTEGPAVPLEKENPARSGKHEG